MTLFLTGFSGRVPDAYIFKCTLETEASAIKTHLENRGLKIKSVVMKSHVDAKTRGFKVSLESQDDFDKLLGGEFIPKNVRVKKYIYFQSYNKNNDNRSKLTNTLTKGLNELDQLGSSVINSPLVNSDISNAMVINSPSSSHTVAHILKGAENSTISVS